MVRLHLLEPPLYPVVRRLDGQPVAAAGRTGHRRPLLHAFPLAAHRPAQPRMCRRSPTYKFIYEWVNAIVFATVVASLIHIFVFQMYVIPSSSMESSLLIGDYLYVSKVAYGPQMPNTPVSFPFVHHTMPFSQTKKSFFGVHPMAVPPAQRIAQHRAQRRGGLQLPRRRHGAAPAAGRHLLRRAARIPAHAGRQGGPRETVPRLHGHHPSGRQARELHQTLRGHRRRLAQNRGRRSLRQRRAAGSRRGQAVHVR